MTLRRVMPVALLAACVSAAASAQCRCPGSDAGGDRLGHRRVCRAHTSGSTRSAASCWSRAATRSSRPGRTAWRTSSSACRTRSTRGSASPRSPSGSPTCSWRGWRKKGSCRPKGHAVEVLPRVPEVRPHHHRAAGESPVRHPRPGGAARHHQHQLHAGAGRRPPGQGAPRQRARRGLLLHDGELRRDRGDSGEGHRAAVRPS